MYSAHRNTLVYTDTLRAVDVEADRITLAVRAMNEQRRLGHLSDAEYARALDAIGTDANAMHDVRHREAIRQGMPNAKLGLLPLPGTLRFDD